MLDWFIHTARPALKRKPVGNKVSVAPDLRITAELGIHLSCENTV